MKSQIGAEVRVCPQLPPWYTVLKCPPPYTPELGSGCCAHTPQKPAQFSGPSHAPCWSLWAPPASSWLCQAFCLLGGPDTAQSPSPHSVPVNPTPPPLLTQVPCLAQPRASNPQSARARFPEPSARVLVANSAGIAIQRVATRPGPPGPHRPQYSALRPSPPAVPRSRAAITPLSVPQLSSLLGKRFVSLKETGDKYK